MLFTSVKVTLGMCAVLAVSACEPSIEVTTPEVQAGYLAGFSQDRIARARVSTIRSYTGRDSERTEFSGAECDVLSGEVSAHIVTPAKIILPAFVQNRNLENRGRPTGLRIVCTANGNTGVETFVADDKSTQAATNAGLAGFILTSVVSGAIAASSPWSYPANMAVQVDGVSH